MTSRIGCANSATHSGNGVAVIVGRGEAVLDGLGDGVIDGRGVLLIVGVKLGVAVLVAPCTIVIVDPGFTVGVLHA